MVVLDNLHVTSCKDDGATVLDYNLDFFLKPAYASHPVYPQVMMQTAVNVGDLTVFSMLYVDGFNAMLLHHGSNVMHVRGVQ